MVKRIYVEKKPGFDVKAKQLTNELQEILGIRDLESLQIINRYDVEGIDDSLFKKSISTVFSEPSVDNVYENLSDIPGYGLDQTCIFAVEYVPGQFDQRADSASECIQLISQGRRPQVKSSVLYLLSGDLDTNEIERIKDYLINPVESREASLEAYQTLTQEFPEPKPVEVVSDFLDFDKKALESFIEERGLAMDIADALYCQEYFSSEGRPPTITEIKMIDTYWSDHCRHTTFGTVLTDLKIADENVERAFNKYLEMRHDLQRDDRDICLMDMGTIGAKWLKSKGELTGLDESEEINACTVKVKVDVDGENQDWLYLFKNETHNHPTEIEPFGGAATCVGGAIRDPLSGRSYVYQAMRVTGAADPTVPVSETLPGKLPQRKLVTTAASGYSSYGNQIGLATGEVHEIYHPGYAAKRMEIGAVVGAAPAANVKRETPASGDVVVLLGGRTGRDGIGGATGSSKAHAADSLANCGAEVQKGNPPVERKIQRLFRREDACRMIKRCNDFGAGGVSVAIGELADGMQIDLDAVPRKYEGLDGTELAISESQERMAVALAPQDVDAFISLAREENLEATPVAVITDDPRVKMTWRGDTIVDVSREFLASNGAPKYQDVIVDEHANCGEISDIFANGNEDADSNASIADCFYRLVEDINIASNKGLSERFDSTIGAASVLMPFGGKSQLTPALAMVAKLPVLGETTTVSGLAWGFNPYISERDPYKGAYLAVVESIAKLVATGFNRRDMYLTFQEYFERLRGEGKRWGKPVAALLGALMAQVDLKVGAIGGKDSMSGSFEDLDVPPTLVSFATAVGDIDNITSPEFKAPDHNIWLVEPKYESILPEASSLTMAMDYVEKLIDPECRIALSVSTIGFGGLGEALFKMCVGNAVGASISDLQIDANQSESFNGLFNYRYGTFIVETSADIELADFPEDINVRKIGVTTKEYVLDVCGESIDLCDLQEKWEAAFETVFPYRGKSDYGFDESELEKLSALVSVDAPTDGNGLSDGIDDSVSSKTAHQKPESPSIPSFAHTSGPIIKYDGKPYVAPQVIVPVFPGTNCEYDTQMAFERAGAKVKVQIINNLSAEAVAESTKTLVENINHAQIIMLPGGFSGGDEPDGSAKFIASFFRSPSVTEAVRELLQRRDGLMLGICNGFQALVKLGLLPYGDILPAEECEATLTFNTIGRHQSKLVNTKIASNLSPWMSECKVGDIYTVAISHGEGRFVAPFATMATMAEDGQIATQYVDDNGCPTMDIQSNPPGSLLAIEGISSADGRILGKMGHSERSGNGLYKNVPGNLYQPIFEGGVSYFQ